MANNKKDNMELNVDLFKEACAFTLQSRRWGNTRQADKDKITTDADKDLLRVTKKLVECDEYEAIVKFMSETRRYVVRRSVPSFFLKGAHLVKLQIVKMIADFITDRRTILKEKLVPAFLAAYPEAKEKAKVKLNGQYEESDYPDEETMAALFDINYNFVSFVVPEGLPPELAKIEKEKMEEQWRNTALQVTESLRYAFAELVSHMTDRLKVEPGEKPKIFKNTTVGNILEFIDTFQSRNITNDVELGKLVEQARQIVRGVEPDKLRKDVDMRNRIAEKMQEVKSAVDSLITTAPSRAFSLTDDE